MNENSKGFVLSIGVYRISGVVILLLSLYFAHYRNVKTMLGSGEQINVKVGCPALNYLKETVNQHKLYASKQTIFFITTIC